MVNAKSSPCGEDKGSGMRENRLSRHMLAGLLLVGLGWSLPTLALDVPRISIPTVDKPAGAITDGTLIAQGQIAFLAGDARVAVWSDALKSGGQPNRYVLRGTQNGANTVRVRIDADGGQPDKEGGYGVIINTGSGATAFRVVADGDQTVVADRYQLAVRGATVAPGAGGVQPTDASDIQVATINVLADLTVNHTLLAVSPHFACDQVNNALLLRGEVSFRDNAAHRAGVRFTPGSADVGTDMFVAAVAGKNDPTHKLKVKLHFPYDAQVSDGWIVSRERKASFDYSVLSDGEQTVPSDSYRVSVDSGLWTD